MAVGPLLLITLLGSGLGNLLVNPPKDLASLLEPKVVLEKMEAKTDEASLIGYLTPKKTNTPLFAPGQVEKLIDQLGAADFKARAAARKRLEGFGAHIAPQLKKALGHNDPEVKVTVQKLLKKVEAGQKAAADAARKDYVRNLMAVRVLAEMKSTKGVPVLRQFAEEAALKSDITSAAAAKNAIDIIEGKPEARPEIKGVMLDVMSRLPLDTSFVLTLDMATGAKTITASSMIKDALKNPNVQGGMMPANAMAEMEPQAIKGITTALEKVGNVRIDAIFMTFSGSFGTEDKSAQYLGFIFKGLYDPKRMEAIIKEEAGLQSLAMQGKTIFHDGRDTAFCCVDKNTFLIAVSPDRKAAGLQMQPVLQGFTKKVGNDVAELEALKKRMPKLIPAVTDLLEGKGRIGMAGSLSDVQRKEAKSNIAAELDSVKKRVEENPSPEKQFQLTAMEMAVELVNAVRYSGVLAPASGVSLKVHCASPETAAAMQKTMAAFDKGCVKMLMQAKAQLEGMGQGQMPPQFKKMFEAITPNMVLFSSKATESSVTISVDLKNSAFMQSWMFMSAPMMR